MAKHPYFIDFLITGRISKLIRVTCWPNLPFYLALDIYPSVTDILHILLRLFYVAAARCGLLLLALKQMLRELSAVSKVCQIERKEISFCSYVSSHYIKSSFMDRTDGRMKLRTTEQSCVFFIIWGLVSKLPDLERTVLELCVEVKYISLHFRLIKVKLINNKTFTVLCHANWPN